MKSIVVVLALASCFVAQPAWAGLDENIGAELKRLCSAGKSITAVTDGHCCWANQEWSIKLERCVGRPLCPFGYVRYEESCVLEHLDPLELEAQRTPHSAPNSTTSPFAPTPLESTDIYIEIAADTFTMGSDASVPSRSNDELEHELSLSRDFMLKNTELTRDEWFAVMGVDPRENMPNECGGDCPVDYVNWFEALAFLNALSEAQGLGLCYELSNCEGTLGGGCAFGEDSCQGDYSCDVVFVEDCTGYRLPTEAEWEFAALANEADPLYDKSFYNRGLYDAPELDFIAWYGGNSGVQYDGYTSSSCEAWPEKQYPSSRCGAHPVGRKSPNEFGLFDMLGNVWEWTSDWYGPYSLDEEWSTSPEFKVFRGASWYDFAAFVRPAFRGYADPQHRSAAVGFRPARTLFE